MGVEADAVFSEAPQAPTQMQMHMYTQEVEQQCWAETDDYNKVKTLTTTTSSSSSSNGSGGARGKKRGMPPALRKSYSDRPLGMAGASVASQLNQLALGGSSSLQSGLDDEADADDDHTWSMRRRQISARADEIMRSKHQVGVQVGETCPVCLTDDVDTQLGHCGHRVHAKCIKRWIQSGSQCPVCREPVTEITEAFASPAAQFALALEKDRSEVSTEDAGSPGDDGAFEWGWFEDFDDLDDSHRDHTELSDHMLLYRRQSAPDMDTHALDQATDATAPLMNREMSTTFEVCRTFPPLRMEYDTPYAESEHKWMHSLPSHRHIAAKIQIRSFRIVETTANRSQHAEYLVELQLDGRYFSRWRRYSDISKAAARLRSREFREALTVWSMLEATSRWFNRLELNYLHRRCRQLETFAHALLLECTTAYQLADLLGA